MRVDVALMALVCCVISMSYGPGAHVLRVINYDPTMSLGAAFVTSSNISAGLLHSSSINDGPSSWDPSSQGLALDPDLAIDGFVVNSSHVHSAEPNRVVRPTVLTSSRPHGLTASRPHVLSFFRSFVRLVRGVSAFCHCMQTSLTFISYPFAFLF